MKILLDTNVIIDVALDRPPFVDHAVQIIEHKNNQEYQLYITTSSITDIYYVTSKHLGKKKSLQFLKELTPIVECCHTDKNVIHKALNSHFKDFEDAVQYFSALNSNIDIIVTRNEKDFKPALIEVLNPKQFVEKYLQQ